MKSQSLIKLIHNEAKSTLDELGVVTKQDLQDLASKIETPGKQEKA